MRRAPGGSVLTVGLAIVALAGCGGQHKQPTGGGTTTTTPTGTDDETSFLEDGTDTSAAASDPPAIVSSLVSSSAGGSIGLASTDIAGGDLAPASFGDGALALYLPRTCLTVDAGADGKSATYTFKGCTGPNGLRAVKGVLHVGYATTASSLHLDITADALSVNGATVDWTAKADITASNSDRTMTWDATLSGTTAGGRTFEQQTEFTLSWSLGDACVSLSGSSDGQVSKNGTSREIRTSVTNYRRCKRDCPDAGATITVTNVAKNKQVALEYDGTDVATFTAANGSETAISLLCKE